MFRKRVKHGSSLVCSAKDFSKSIGLTDGKEVILCNAIRTAMEMACKVEKDSLVPSLDTREINNLAFDGVDPLEFCMALEDELDILIPDEVASSLFENFSPSNFDVLIGKESLTFGEWTLHVISILISHMRKLE